jgi:WD40 repeat protein
VITVVLAPVSAYGASAGEGGTGLWGRRANGPGNSDDSARVIAASPDDTRIFVTGSSVGSSGTRDYATIGYDAATGVLLWAKRYHGPDDGQDDAYALAVSADGSMVFVTGGSDGATGADYATVAYDASTGALRWVKRYNGPGNGDDAAVSVAAAPDGSTVFVTGGSIGATGADFATIAYDASTGAVAWARRYNGPGNGHDEAVGITTSLDGSAVFVTGSSDGTDRRFPSDYATIAYDGHTGEVIWIGRADGYLGGDDYPSGLATSPDGAMVFVTGGFDVQWYWGASHGTVAYDTSTGTQLWVASAACGGDPGGPVCGPADFIAASGSTVVVSGYNGPGGDATVAYDGSTGTQLWALEEYVYSLTGSPDGSKVFATGAYDGAAGCHCRTWALDAATGVTLWDRQYQGPGQGDDRLNSVIVSPSGSTVFVTGSSVGEAGNDDYITLAYAA